MANQNIMRSSKAKERLLSQVREGRVSHAYIFAGSSSGHKKELAFFFAAALLCRGENRPCGVCAQCSKVFERAHQDVHFTESTEGKSIGVDRVREIGKSAYTVPGEGEWSVYIIDSAEKMTVQAQNALLKVLEEPPKPVAFVLLAASLEALLPTIRSRAVILHIPLPTLEEKADYIRREIPGLTEKDLLAAAAFEEDIANGKAADDALQQMKWAAAFLESLLSNNKAEYLKNYTKLSKNRGILTDAAEAVAKLCRDIGLAKDGIDGDRFYREYHEQVSRMAAALTKKKILKLYDIAAQTLRLFNGTYSNASLAAIVFLNRCWEETH